MHIVTRLSSVAPELLELAGRLSEGRRKATAARIAEWACRESGALAYLDKDRVRTLLGANHSAMPEERRRLSADVESLDEKYLALVDLNDGLDDEGEALGWFRKARAAAALLYSLDAVATHDFCESLYEAFMATNNLARLKALCDAGE